MPASPDMVSGFAPNLNSSEEVLKIIIEAEKNKLSMIRLVTPTTNEKRLNKILFNATGFVYYVSITGITGTQAPNIEDASKSLKKISLLN